MCSPRQAGQCWTSEHECPLVANMNIWNLFYCLRVIEIVIKFCSFSDWNSNNDAFREQRAPHPATTARGGWRGRGGGVHPQADWRFFPTGTWIHQGSGSTHQWRSGPFGHPSKLPSSKSTGDPHHPRRKFCNRLGLKQEMHMYFVFRDKVVWII